MPLDDPLSKSFRWGSGRSPTCPLPGELHGPAEPYSAARGRPPALGAGKSQGKWKCKPPRGAPVSCLLGRGTEDTGTPT